MPNSHLRCKQCEDYVSRETIITLNFGKFCCWDCVDVFVKDTQEKEKLKKIKKAYGAGGGRKKGKTKKQCDNDLKTRKEATKTACHAFIRDRDRGKPCISCQRPWSDDFHAGHYLESGNNSKIRYDEDNINGQCVSCNSFKGGNAAEYRGNLIKKIGLKRVERLESMRGGSVKRSPQDYKEIEDYYKSKFNILS
jgi:hypothetical protein